MSAARVHDLPARAEMQLLIVFADLTRFTAMSRQVADPDLADTVDAFYQMVVSRVAAAGGRVVKFMGDAALIVFPEDGVDEGVEALLDLKQSIDAWMAGLGWECRLHVKAHFGQVVAGPFAGPGEPRFDVLGKEVNAAALLDSTGVALSVAAFRKLSPALRKRFKKHTPPVTYIRTEDPHRLRPGRPI